MKRFAAIAAVVLLCSGGEGFCSAPDEASNPVSDERSAPEAGIQFQELEDPVVRLKPVKPRAAGDEARLDAMAWFAAGRLLQDRGDREGALRAYRKAIESDPTVASVLRDALRLAIDLKQFDLAATWAKKAVELDPGNLQLLTQAIDLLVNQEDLPGAIQLLELAVKVPDLDRQSPTYVFLMRQLAVLYSAVDRTDDAVAGFEVLFDALTNPEKYKLDARTKTRLQNDPASNFEKMGQIFLAAKKTDLALAAFRKAAEAAESKKGATGALHFNLAQVYLQAGQPAQALEEIQKYIDSQHLVKDQAPYELLGQILEKLGKSQELIPRLEAAAENDSRNSTLQYFLAEQYSRANRLEEAEKLFKKTLEYAAEPQGYVGLAGVYRRKGRPSDLIDSLGRGFAEAGDLKIMASEFKALIADEKLLAAVLEAGLKRIQEQPPALDFAAGYVLANLAADGKQADAAERLYRFLLSVRKEQAATIFEELARFFIEIRKYPEAVKVCQEAIDEPELADNRPNFLFMLTSAHELSGNTKKALEAITAAQQMMPNNPLLRFQEAWVYYHSHQFEEAIPKYQKLIADFPQGPVRDLIRKAQYSLSNIYVLQGDVKKGLEILETIYKDTPNDIQVNNDLGYLYADNGIKLDQAESMIRKALAAEPENAAYLDSMGWVLFKLGKLEEAVPYLEKAITISTGGGDETLYDHLGDVYSRLQQPAKALEAWKKSLDLAREAPFPDKKLIERVEEKLKNQKQDGGKLKPAAPGTP